MHFYPRSPCGERQLAIYNQLLIQNISIHALLAESDVAGLIFRAKFVIFLSTLSLRRATSAPAIKSCWSSYFYPRSPCGERLRVSVGDAHVCVISIHALLAESDRSSRRLRRKELHFYPRSPCGERLQRLSTSRQNTYFYPRSPCGERLYSAVNK